MDVSDYVALDMVGQRWQPNTRHVELHAMQLMRNYSIKYFF